MTPGSLSEDPQAAINVARTLQRGLIPQVATSVAGLHVTSRYLIGGLGEVGGDWYDVLELPGGGAAAVIGDVAGHGIGAATTMGELRHSVRAYLLDDRGPGTVLSKVSRLTQWLLPGEVATCLIAVFDAATDEVRLASAGHVPPLLLGDGWAEYVALQGGPALGVVDDATYPEMVQHLGDASLLLFTDGLIERRGEAIDEGLERLAAASARYGGEGDFVDRLIAEVPAAGAADDLALIAVCREDRG